MRAIISLLLGFALVACGAPEAPSGSSPAAGTDPPPIPEGAETVEFDASEPAPALEEKADTKEAATASASAVYWGVEEGEALTIMWEDLMPEGSEEALMAEYEAFYAMLEQRYAANTTTLADADPYAMIEEGSEFDYMPQLGNFDTVEDLDGQHARIPGYVVPFDFNTDRQQTEFLFVPYMGACIHSPPPPPNQIIFVRADPAVRIKDIWVPYWLEGTLSTEKTENDLGNTAYSMSMMEIEPYPMP